MSVKRANKMLFIFDLNGVLGYASNQPTESAQTFYNKSPDYVKEKLQVWHRPNLNFIVK